MLRPAYGVDWICPSHEDFLTVHSLWRVTRLEEAALSPCLKSIECKQLANVFLTRLSFLFSFLNVSVTFSSQSHLMSASTGLICLFFLAFCLFSYIGETAPWVQLNLFGIYCSNLNSSRKPV